MTTVLRNLLSFVLPVTVTVVVPGALLGWRPRTDDIDPLRGIVGGLLLVAGLAMLVSTVSLFIRIGRGTLAPNKRNVPRWIPRWTPWRPEVR